jgi:hypothetical protein
LSGRQRINRGLSTRHLALIAIGAAPAALGGNHAGWGVLPAEWDRTKTCLEVVAREPGTYVLAPGAWVGLSPCRFLGNALPTTAAQTRQRLQPPMGSGKGSLRVDFQQQEEKPLLAMRWDVECCVGNADDLAGSPQARGWSPGGGGCLPMSSSSPASPPLAMAS